MRIPLNKQEIFSQFIRQINRLKRYATQYDEGDEDVATEMSVKLRVLFHATDRSKSLINQLKVDTVPFITSCSRRGNNTRHLAFTGLVVIQVDEKNDTIELKPKFDNALRSVNFSTWWKKEIVLIDNKNNEFTRKQLVTSMANMDGGAHVDDSLEANYHTLSRRNSVGITFNMGQGEKNINNPVLPSIRQITHETLLTFESFI